MVAARHGPALFPLPQPTTSRREVDLVNATQQPNCEVIQADSHNVSSFLGCPGMTGMIGSSRGKLEAAYDVDGEKLLL